VSDSSGLDRAINDLARALAPGLASTVVEESRREALRLVREHLTEALVREMEHDLSSREAPSRHEDPNPAADPVTERAATGSRSASVTRHPGPAGQTGHGQTGWYVYGITWVEVAEALRHRPGIDGAEVEPIPAGRLAAVVSRVAANGEWGFDAEGNVDLDALAPRARDHERILEELLDRGPVLPLRFGIMYPAIDEVVRVLRRGGPRAEAELIRLTAHSEWGLTVRTAAAVAARDVHGGDIGTDGTAEGRGYLERLRRAREEAERRRADMARLSRELHDRMMHRSATGVVLPPPRADQSCLLRASYLVPDDGLAAFRATAESALSEGAADLGLTGELTGPWPPYHFTDLRLDEEVPA
jgi:hypothetical protein